MAMLTLKIYHSKQLPVIHILWATPQSSDLAPSDYHFLGGQWRCRGGRIGDAEMNMFCCIRHLETCWMNLDNMLTNEILILTLNMQRLFVVLAYFSDYFQYD